MPRSRFDSEDSTVAVLVSKVNSLEKQLETTDEAIGALTAETSGLRVEVAKLATLMSRAGPEAVKHEPVDNTKLIALLAAAFGIMQVGAEIIKTLIQHH